MNYRTMMILTTLMLGCAVEPNDPQPQPQPALPAPWKFDHKLGKLAGDECEAARSTDTTKVRLVGDNCVPDGSVCYDISNDPPEVWATDEATGPYGSASFVEVGPC